jgi:Putative transposase
MRQTAQAVQAQVRHRILRAFERGGRLDKEERREMKCCDHGGGFFLDARPRIEADDCQVLERPPRYCARPPFAAERRKELDAQRLI